VVGVHSRQLRERRRKAVVKRHEEKMNKKPKNMKGGIKNGNS